jgi:hypothetical protein
VYQNDDGFSTEKSPIFAELLSEVVAAAYRLQCAPRGLE